MLTGANVATVIVMLLVGFSDRLNPTDHPLVSTVGMAFPVLLVINMGFLLFWLIFKWSRAWVPVAGFILSYVPISIYMPLNVSPSPPEGALKLVSSGRHRLLAGGQRHVAPLLFQAVGRARADV